MLASGECESCGNTVDWRITLSMAVLGVVMVVVLICVAWAYRYGNASNVMRQTLGSDTRCRAAIYLYFIRRFEDWQERIERWNVQSMRTKLKIIVA